MIKLRRQKSEEQLVDDITPSVDDHIAGAGGVGPGFLRDRSELRLRCSRRVKTVVSARRI
jgi:hypothetical protein